MTTNMTMNRISITKHCETIGNTITATVDAIQVTAGKTAMVFTPYWYVKYHRSDKPDVVLFTNPLDWLLYMESLTPIDTWVVGNPKDSFGADNPMFARMQYLTRGVEGGGHFVCMGMEIWAEKHPTTGRFRYGFATGDNRRLYDSKLKWRTAIKPYLWEWGCQEGVGDERTA